MATGKKNKKHALKRAAIKENLAWTPETVRAGMGKYVQSLLRTPKEKATGIHSHLANIYRGLEAVISCEFGKTPPKTRLVLADYADKYIACVGIAVMVRKFGQRYKLLLARPIMFAEVLGEPTEEKSNYHLLPKHRKIDSHIWLDLEDITKLHKNRLNHIMFGEVVSFTAKPTAYKGKAGGNIKKRGYKYGLSNICFTDTQTSNLNGELYDADILYRLNNKDVLGLIDYSKEEKKYVPMPADVSNIAQMVSENEELQERAKTTKSEVLTLEIFGYQVYKTDPVMKRKVDEYNAKYPEHRIFDD